MRSKTRTIPALMAILMVLAGAITAGMIPALAQDEPEPRTAPTGLTATLSAQGILLTWDDPGDDRITEYEIERESFTPGRLYSERSVTVRLAPRQTHTDSRVEAGRTYSYQIWALSDTGKSEGSEIVTIRAAETPSGKREEPATRQPQPDRGVRQDHNPTLLSLSVSNGTMTPSFSPTTTYYTVNITTNVTRVSVHYSSLNERGVPENDQHTATLTTTGSTTLIPIQVTDRAGGTDASTTYTIDIRRNTTPGPPTWGTTTVADTSRITVDWTDPSYTGVSPITSYNLRYRKSDRIVGWQTISGIIGTIKTIYGLSHSTQYHLEVQAVNSLGPGNWSDTKTVRTTTPRPANRPPRFSESSYTRTVAENTGPVQGIGLAITARDPDGNSITYSLSDTDASAFTVTSGGQLETSGPLNFEQKNHYQFPIQTRDSRGATGAASVTVAVEDVQEPGSVTISPAQAIIHQELTATLEDEDERTSQEWQWARGDSDSGPWSDIGGATHPSYTPAAADRGKYLRATASYDDIETGQTASGKTSRVIDPTLESLTVSPTDINGFRPDRLNYAVGMADSVSQATVTAAAHSGATLTYSQPDDDTNAAGHQVNLSPGLNIVTITVTDGGVSQDYQVTIGRGVTAEYGWKAQADLNTLPAEGNLSPRGIWSDDTTLWVADNEADKLMAHNLQTMARDSQKDISLHDDNRNPRGLWSDGATIWVADSAQAKLYGYPLQDSAPTREFGLHGNNANPWGIWSDGATIWVADRSETKLFAYSLSAQSRNSNRDIELSSGNSSPAGIWSDGLTMWAADSASGKLHAYSNAGGGADTGKDFSTLQAAGNTDPAGLWSDGLTLWVADTASSKLYAYNLPISNNANLRSITIDGESIQDPETENRHYIEARQERVTVSAAPQHPRATVVILPADADNAQEGHQFQLGVNSHDFTVTVTAQDGSTVKTYRVKVITPAGKPAIEEVTPGRQSLEMEWKHPEDTGGVETNRIYYYNLRHIRSDATDRSDGSWTFAYLVWFVGHATPLSYTIEGLTNGVSYDLQVQAWTRAGNSPWSETATGTPSATQDPAFEEGTSASRSVAENAPTNTPIGEPVTATDADQEDTLAYSLAGSDQNHFSIDGGSGQISASGALNFEKTPQYTVDVRVTDGLNDAGVSDSAIDAAITVTIDVENLDEPGSLVLPDTADPPRDTVTITVPAPTDEDRGVTEVTWQWSKSSFSLTGFVNIPGATEASYTPTSGDIGHYLRVRADYTDAQGPDKTVSATTSSTVEEAPNSAPAFTGAPVQYRDVDENTPANTPIGGPVTATDPDEDVLTYSLTGTDASKFSIDQNSGQLRTNVDLDFETKQQYTLQVQVTDGAADATITVTINVNNAEEPGTITVLPITPAVNVALTATLIDPDRSITNTTWQWKQRDALQGSTWEDIAGATSATFTPTQTGRYLQVTAKYDDGHGAGKSAVREIAVSVTNTPPAFDADAPTAASVAENNQEQAAVGTSITATDPNGDLLTYGLQDTDPDSGHAASFSIDGTGQITVAPGVRLDHETQETYRVTVNLSDGRDPDGGTDDRADAFRPIIITVTDANDPGTVTISNSYPQVGLKIEASVADQDGGVTEVTWQWARGNSRDGDFTGITEATGASYTPQQADRGKYLRATVSYTDDTAGADQRARAVTDNPVDEQIALDRDNYTFHTFENSIAGAPVIGDLPEASNTNGTVVYSLSGGDSNRYEINSDDGRITVRKDGQLDYETDSSDSMTIEVTDDSGSRDTAQVTINIKDLMEDDETKTLTIAGHGAITWTRIAETQFLMARDQGGVRRPEFELNAQLDPCFREGNPGEEQLLIRTDWAIYDQYQLDMWWDGDTLRYRDPRRSQEWTGYPITQPDSAHARGANETCPAVYLDLWNDPDTLYALDTSHRLIKAHTLLAAGTRYERDHARDIPLSQDHYRSFNEIQGIWGDKDHIWVNRAEQPTNENLHIAAYSRSTFLRQPTADFDLSTETTRPFRTILDAHLLEGALWTIDLSDREAIYGRDPVNLADVNTCGDSSVTNKTQSALPKLYLRVTGQGNLLYALNYGLQNIDTYNVSSCPPAEAESEFDYQEIEDLPGQGLQAVPSGISTDDGLLMYFSFPTGEIRHIGKILPKVVKNVHTITIRENTKDGVHEPGRQPAGLPFRVRSAQEIGIYNWYLEDPGDQTKSTGCGGTPASGHESDAVHFDCRYSGSRQQSLQILTRDDVWWFDYEEQSSYTFTLRVKDVDDDTHSITLTIHLEDIDETPARPGRPGLSGEEQQSIRVNWSPVTMLAGRASPRTTLDQITGYVVEYTPEGGTTQDVQEVQVTGAGTTTQSLTDLLPNTRYTVQVRAVNGHGSGKISPYAVARTLPNPRPALNHTSFPIQENTIMSGGLVRIGTLTATDPDPQDSVTGYEIQEIGADHSFFKLTLSPDGDAADLALRHVPNFEGQETYTITVRTTSGAGIREESNSEEVTIAVTDVDEPPGTPDAPTISHPRQRRLRASWNPPVNIGPDIHDYDVQYRVKNTANPNTAWSDHPFSGAGNTATLGELERSTIYEVKVKAHNPEGSSDWSPPGEGSTRANIPPVLAGGDTSVTRSVPENSPAGTPVGDPVSATDEDIDDGGQLQYSLQGAGAAAFDIDRDTGQIQVKEPLDHERKSRYEVTVQVIDNQTGEDTAAVTIIVTDVQEKPGAPSPPSVAPGTHANTLSVSWTEPGNTGPAISDYGVSYRKEGAVPWKEWEHEGPGRTNVITMLPHSAVHQVQIRAYNDERWSEWSMPGSGTTAANRSPAFPSGVGDTITLTLPETLGDATDPGRDIGAPITATDPDQGDSVSYSLEGTGADSFTVTSTGQVRTKADRTYDHETRQTYNATLVAQDGESANTGRATVKLIIEITDVDEPPLAPAQPTFTGVSRHQTTVNWTAPSNTGRPDISGYQVKRHLKGDSAEGTPQDVEKDLEGEPLTSHVAINLEDGKTYLFQVRGENDEGWGEWSEPGEATTPANRIPIFQEGSSAARSLPENSQAGVDAGAALTATDEDNDTLTYSIDGENDGEFTIDYRTGRLQSGDHSYDHEATSSHTLTVAVNDGEGGRAAITVTVNITDVEEPPDTPQAPGVTAVSSTSLKASWTAPDNRGRPPIDGYVVQHRIDQDNSNWEDSGHSGSAIQATITGLEPGAAYKVQIKAVNHEGFSGWSEPGTSRTNQSPAVEIGFEHPEYSVPEGNAQTLTVTLSADPERTVTVPVEVTQHGGATSDDYTLNPNIQTVTFNTGETQKTIVFNATQDTEDDDDESVRLTIGSGLPNRVSQGTNWQATVNIQDDDNPQVTVSFEENSYAVAEGDATTIVVTLSVDPERTVTIPVAITHQGGATPSDYDLMPAVTSLTFNAGETRKTLTFTAAQDTEDDDDERVTLAFGSRLPDRISRGTNGQATVDIGDDDHPRVGVTFGQGSDTRISYSVPEGNAQTLTVTLSADPERTISIPILVTHQGGTTSDDYTLNPNIQTVTFNTGETQKTIIFSATQDDLDDDGESVILTYGTLPDGTSPSGGVEITIDILDDDDPVVTVQFEHPEYGVFEGGEVTLAVVLSADPERTVTVPLTRTNQGGTTGSDYSGVPPSLTFASGETRKTFVFAALEDTDQEDGESVKLGFGTRPGRVDLGANDETTVAIRDCEGGGIWCATLLFGVLTESAAGRKWLTRERLDHDQFVYNGITYGIGTITLRPNRGGVTNPGAPFSIPERATLLFSLVNLSAANRQDRWTMPNEDHLDWTLHISAGNDGETLEAALPFNEAKFCCGRKWRSYGLDLDELNAAWSEGKLYRLRIVEDPRADRVAEAPGAPLHLEVTGSTRRSVGISWVRPQTRNDGAPPGVSYRIEWKMNTDSWGTEDDVSEHVYEPRPGNEWLFYTIRGLTPGVWYNVRVIAVNTVGASEPSNVATGRTKPDPGQAPAPQAEPEPNNPATGQPTITGMAQMGRTLTADVSGIGDADGLENAAYTYQWLAGDAEIAGATGAKYTVVSVDEGKAIRVRVGFTDDAGNEETLTSAATEAAAAAGLRLQSATVDGAAMSLTYNEVLDEYVSLPLTAFTVTAAGTDRSLSQAAVSGSAVILTLAQAAAAGETVTVDYTRPDGPDFVRDTRGRAADSFSGRKVTNQTPTAETGDPFTASIHDAPASHDGRTVFTFELRFSEEPKSEFSYTTLRDHAFTVTRGEISGVRRLEPPGNTRWEIQVRPGSRDSVGIMLPITTDCAAGGAICTQDGRMLSNRLEFNVAAPNTPATGQPSVTGAPRVGETLTAATTGIEDADGLANAVFTYRWLAGGTDIEGAVAASYTLTADEEGLAIKVRVSFTDDGGNPEAVTSAATGPVAAAWPPLTAGFLDTPESHDGSAVFTFELRLSEEPKSDFSYTTLRDHAFTVTGGEISGVRRLEPPGNTRWEIQVRPNSESNLEIVLPVTTDCAADGAVCTGDGRMLSNRLEITVPGPSG